MGIKGNGQKAFTFQTLLFSALLCLFQTLLLSALLCLFTAMEMHIIKTVFVKVPYYYCKLRILYHM